MTYQALYRTYRPEKLSDMVGQEEAVSLIQGQLDNNELTHAYLFSGPRGVGKTTLARIIAKELGCDPVFDVAEIDAASHNKVDDIRDLNESVNFVASSPDKKRIFILDEVHMLSNAASNAFLKTLEEPPDHVVFILATTEPERVLETIKSRTTHVIFKKIDEEVILSRLSSIAKKEKMKISKEILGSVANFSDGSLRDAINLMEQGFNTFGEKITEDNLYTMLGKLNREDIDILLNAIQTQDTTAVIDLAKVTFSKGIQPKDFLLSLSEFFRNVFHLKYLSHEPSPNELSTSMEKLVNKANDQFTSQQIVRILDLLDDANVEVKKTSSHQLKLELFLVKLVRPELGTDPKTVAYRVDLIEGKINSDGGNPIKEEINDNLKSKQPKESGLEEKKNEDSEKKNEDSEKKIQKGELKDFDVHWPKILIEAKESLSPKKYAYLTSIFPAVEGNVLIFQVPEGSEFLLGQINNDEELISLVRSLVAKRLGIEVQVRAEVVSGDFKGSAEDTLKLAQEMFGAEEIN